MTDNRSVPLLDEFAPASPSARLEKGCADSIHDVIRDVLEDPAMQDDLLNWLNGGHHVLISASDPSASPIVAMSKGPPHADVQDFLAAGDKHGTLKKT